MDVGLRRVLVGSLAAIVAVIAVGFATLDTSDAPCAPLAFSQAGHGGWIGYAPPTSLKDHWSNYSGTLSISARREYLHVEEFNGDVWDVCVELKR